MDVINVSTTPAGDTLFTLPFAILLGTYKQPSGPKAVPFGVLKDDEKIDTTPDLVILETLLPMYLEAKMFPALSSVRQSSNDEGPGTKVLTTCEYEAVAVISVSKSTRVVKVFFISSRL